MNDVLSAGQAAKRIKAAAQASKTGSAAAKGASAGGVWGAIAGAAISLRKPLAKVMVGITALLLIPVMFILMLPSLIFGGLTSASAAGSSQVIMNDDVSITENLNRIVTSINQILDEGIANAEERIAADFATQSADYYEIVNPYGDNPVSNANLFLAEYCAAKDVDWKSISIADMERLLRAGLDQLYTFTYETETREVEADDPETPDVVETAEETWIIYTLCYQGEEYFADTIFHLSSEQKELADDYAHNLNLYLLNTYVPTGGAPMIVPEGYGSAAAWIQSHIDAYGNMDATARQTLFGNVNKTYFSSAEEAMPYLRCFKIPVWKIDSNGAKYASTAWLTVHAFVAADVEAIFEEIYNDPEHFPIDAIGGARFSDTLRHSWGCAIDINPYENCECNFFSGSQRLTCGYGWWPDGMSGKEWVGRNSAEYHGTLKQASPYSIKPGGSVVRAFAAHGWGWGGNGWYGGKGFDFMHFSVLSSGG